MITEPQLSLRVSRGIILELEDLVTRAPVFPKETVLWWNTVNTDRGRPYIAGAIPCALKSDQATST
jgi:hypothetical protein